MRECCDSVTCSLKSDAEETIYKYSNACGHKEDNDLTVQRDRWWVFYLKTTPLLPRCCDADV